MSLTVDDNSSRMKNIQSNKEQRKTTMTTLLIISMTATMTVVAMWVYNSFKWQGWGKI